MTLRAANFKRREFACGCGCGFDTVDAELLYLLQQLRDYFACPVRITSAARCKTHNHAVGGSETSQHLVGKAADIIVSNINADLVANHLEHRYVNRYGIGRYDGRTHIDVRPTKARWDHRGRAL